MQSPEAKQLLQEANQILTLLNENFQTHAIFKLAEANSEDNDVWIENTRFPFLRQQTAKEGKPYLCLSDFIRPKSQEIKDYIGLFATTVDAKMEQLYPEDHYQHLLVKTLSDRLAEATAEKLHETVRKTIWGYAPDEQLSIEQLHNEEFQGIRPAVGYPSLPDQSVNFLLEELLDMQQIGIHLTENGMMQPHASVSGLMLAHPASRYFSIGKIDEEQLHDYASRRRLPVEQMRKFLAANL
jgi:cobalamin-dependent methionine synthase I